MMGQPMNMQQHQQMQAVMANMQAQQQGLARAAPERLTVYKGFVKTVNEKGFAFVTCPAVTAKFRRDVYFDSDEVQRGGLADGKEVDFVLRRNERGQPTGKVVPPNGIFTGLLKNYQEDKGFGFLICEEATRLFEMDVWVHGREVRVAGIHLGQEMQFYIQLNSKNQPQAVAVRRHQGFVKKRGKYTFIESAEVKQTYGKDAFVKDGEGFLEGLRVSFLLTFSDNMDPQAEDVEITGDVDANEYPNPQANAHPSIGDDAGGPSRSAGEENEIRAILKNMEEQSDTMYEGIVKSWGAQYGFVESQEIKRRSGKDVFIPASIGLRENINVGDAVLFTMSINAQGNPQALQVKKICVQSNVRKVLKDWSQVSPIKKRGIEGMEELPSKKARP